MKMKLEQPLSSDEAVKAVARSILHQYPEKFLRGMCRLFGSPIKKRKQDTVPVLVDAMVAHGKTTITVTTVGLKVSKPNTAGKTK